MLSITYPGSRANGSKGKVGICNGEVRDDGYIRLRTDDGVEHRLLKRTCYYCGYTIFFEPETAKKARYTGGDAEVFPE